MALSVAEAPAGSSAVGIAARILFQPRHERSSMNGSKTLEYFYDLSSPYAYMAVEEVQLVAARCSAVSETGRRRFQSLAIAVDICARRT